MRSYCCQDSWLLGGGQPPQVAQPLGRYMGFGQTVDTPRVTYSFLTFRVFAYLCISDDSEGLFGGLAKPG